MTKPAARIPDKLRQSAELRLVTRHRTKAVPQDAGRLVRELRLHEIELEMQNEELQAAKHQLAEALARQTGLFEHAPLGYVVLDAGGSIREANREASRMLGTPRKGLVGRRIALFIAEADRVAFADLLDEALAKTSDEGRRALIDVMLYADGNDRREVRLIASAGTSSWPLSLTSCAIP